MARTVVQSVAHEDAAYEARLDVDFGVHALMVGLEACRACNAVDAAAHVAQPFWEFGGSYG